jgi:hypothetical protein
MPPGKISEFLAKHGIFDGIDEDGPEGDKIAEAMKAYIASRKPGKPSKRDPDLDTLRTQCSKRKSARKSKPAKDKKVVPLDGRRLCVAIKSDGNRCTFKAKSMEGYCQRHMPGSQTSMEKANEAERLRLQNARAKKWMDLTKPALPACPKCKQMTLTIEFDVKYFDMVFVLCANPSCCGRTNLINIAQAAGWEDLGPDPTVKLEPKVKVEAGPVQGVRAPAPSVPPWDGSEEMNELQYNRHSAEWFRSNEGRRARLPPCRACGQSRLSIDWDKRYEGMIAAVCKNCGAPTRIHHVLEDVFALAAQTGRPAVSPIGHISPLIDLTTPQPDKRRSRSRSHG